MSTRELVFEYTTRGARAAAKADERVRSSVEKTGRVANRNSGSVERWMQRSRKAINMVAMASLAAVGAILAASPTIRAELSGMRAAFMLFSDTIVNDLLPGAGSLSSKAIELAQDFRELDDRTRTLSGGLLVAVAGLSAIAFAVSSTAALVVAGFSAQLAVMASVLRRFDALGHVMSAWMNMGRAVIALVTGDFAGAWGHAKEAVRDFARAAGAIFATMVRTTIDNARWLIGRVLDIFSAAHEFGMRAREWVDSMASGVRQRAGALVQGFRNMASDAASAFVSKFNEIVPASVQIPSVSINIPDVLGGGSVGIGGGSINLPQLDTGGRIARTGMAVVHEGERIMPAAQVRERGTQPTDGGGVNIENVTIMVNDREDPQRQGRDIAREFSRELSDRGA